MSEIRRGTAAVQQGIQELITAGVFAAGDRLVEDDLANRLNVSRTPVREALHALAARGLVTRAARTWTVRRLDVRDIREMYEVRCALECMAARLAASRCSPEDAHAIAAANDASRTGPSTDFTPASQRVHGLIAAAADNRRLAEELAQFQLIYFSRPIATLYTPDEIEDSIAEHEAVARAVADKDPDAADTAMRRHIEHAFDLLVRKLAWLS